MMRMGVPQSKPCLCQTSTSFAARMSAPHRWPEPVIVRAAPRPGLRSIRSALLLSQRRFWDGPPNTGSPSHWVCRRPPDLVLDKVEGGLLKMRRTACRHSSSDGVSRSAGGRSPKAAGCLLQPHRLSPHLQPGGMETVARRAKCRPTQANIHLSISGPRRAGLEKIPSHMRPRKRPQCDRHDPGPGIDRPWSGHRPAPRPQVLAQRGNRRLGHLGPTPQAAMR